MVQKGGRLSRVAVFLMDFGNDKKKVMSLTRERTNLGMSEIVRRVSSKEPVLVCKMYGLELMKSVSDIRDYVQSLVSNGAHVELVHLLNDEETKTFSTHLRRITLEMMENRVKALSGDAERHMDLYGHDD